MLSIETETRMVRLFNKLAEAEKSVEVNRKLLAEISDFDPYLAFKRIDRDGKGYIDAIDIVNFLK
jgi:hypothetical protein